MTRGVKAVYKFFSLIFLRLIILRNLRCSTRTVLRSCSPIPHVIHITARRY